MNKNEKEAVLICDKCDEETSASLRELFPDALCMQVNSITGAELLNFVVTIAGIYAALNVSTTIKDLFERDKVELKIGNFSVKGSYKHAVELTEKYLKYTKPKKK